MLKITVSIKCQNKECVNEELVGLKRGLDNELSFTDSFDNSEKFFLKQYHPDATEIECLECGYEEELSL